MPYRCLAKLHWSHKEREWTGQRRNHRESPAHINEREQQRLLIDGTGDSAQRLLTRDAGIQARITKDLVAWFNVPW
jgi:hypothetical protein